MAAQRKVLIAGGAGFLGSHLSRHYLAQGDLVVVIDNLSSGRLENLTEVESHKLFSFIEHDIVHELPKTVTNGVFDIIINLASPASPPHYQRLAIETLQVGSVGTLRLLDLARDKNARFFHASTSEVYGDPEVHPQPESYKGSVNCYGPRSMYDESKRYAEALIYSHHQKFNTNTCLARFFNTYGPFMDPNDGRVVSNFIVQALKGDPLTIYGAGDQTRSFCYADDLVAGIAGLIDSDFHDPMNLGNPGEFTMLELAELVLKLTKSASKVTHLPLPGDDPTQRKPVIDLAKQVLLWEPKITLEAGLVKTIDYFKEQLRAV